MANKMQDGFIDKLLDVLVLILAQPRTQSELIEITEYKKDTVRNYLRRAVDLGLIYILRFDPHPQPGQPDRAVYAIQPSPFEKPNAPRPR